MKLGFLAGWVAAGIAAVAVAACVGGPFELAPGTGGHGGHGGAASASSGSTSGSGGTSVSTSASGAGGMSCQAPKSLECNGVCVNPNSDSDNCNGCGNTCVGGHFCHNGMCECPQGQNECGGINGTCMSGPCQACSGGQVFCSGNCVSSDATHCGPNCEVCGPQQSCGTGGCTCPSGSTKCGMACADTKKDADNCGMCGHECTVGDICLNSACTCTSPVSPCSQSCGPNAMACGASCASCNHGQVCDPGTLNPPTPATCVCENGLTSCNGSCVNEKNDGKHCGGCDPTTNVCDGGQVCIGGTCQDESLCNGANQTVCNTTRSCVNLNNDYFNCGQCGNVCAPGQLCVATKCEQVFTSPACPGACGTGCPACGTSHMCCDIVINGNAHAVCVQGTQCPG